MRKNRFYFLIQEYRLLQERLNEARADYIKVSAQLEIYKKLERELTEEISRATNFNDPARAKQWTEILEKHFPADKDRPSKETAEKAEKLFKDKESLIAYYEKKMLVVRALLGARQVELVESFEEKNIMMREEGMPAGDPRALDQEEEKPPQEGDGFFLGKM